MRLLFWFACMALAWLAPQRVYACGATPESYTLLTDEMGRLPGGTKVLKLYVYGHPLEPTAPTATLSADPPGASQAVNIPVTLRVAAPWLIEVDLGSATIQGGVSYALTVKTAPVETGSASQTIELPFAGVEAKRMPSELGTLTLDKRASGRFPWGGCGGSEEGEQVLIKLNASAAATPWLRAVKHQLYVDGVPAFDAELPLVDYVARPSQPVVRATATCMRTNVSGDVPFEQAIDLRVPAGQHTVHWTSTFADGSSLQTPAIDMDLRCSSSASSNPQTPPCCKPLYPADAGAGAPVAGDAGVNITTPVDQASAPAVSGDAALAHVDSGAPAAAVAADHHDPDANAEAGCSLAHGQRGATQALGLLLTLVALCARKRNGR